MPFHYPLQSLQIADFIVSHNLRVHDGSNFVAHAVAGWTVGVGFAGAGDDYGVGWGVANGGAARDE